MERERERDDRRGVPIHGEVGSSEPAIPGGPSSPLRPREAPPTEGYEAAWALRGCGGVLPIIRHGSGFH